MGVVDDLVDELINRSLPLGGVHSKAFPKDVFKPETCAFPIHGNILNRAKGMRFRIELNYPGFSIYHLDEIVVPGT